MERRAFPRYETDHETTYCLINEFDEAKARIRNVSRVGIKLLVEREIESGEMLQIRLPVSGGGILVMACVMHCSFDESEHGWSLGCIFSAELADNEVMQLGGEPLETGFSQTAQMNVASVMLGKLKVSKLPEGENPVYEAQITQVQSSGLYCLLDEKMTLGSVVSLQMDADGAAPISILACVVYFKENFENDQHLVGCNFIRELDEFELQQLV